MKKIHLFKELKSSVHGKCDNTQMYLNLNEIHLPNFGTFREQKYIHRPLQVTDRASNL